MDRLLAHKLWGVVPWSLLALAAVGIAVVYLVVDTSHGTTGLAWVVLRWFHSLCWVLLAAAALAVAQVTPLPASWAAPLAVASGVTYAIFAITGVLTGTLFQ